MTSLTARTLEDVLDYLRTLSQHATPPREARAALRPLQQDHPHTTMDLVWEEQAYDGSVHYDVLMRDNDRGTVSLSYCPDQALPWPLRGVHRWTDQDLLRVNHTRLPVSQAVACLDFVWEQAPVIDRLVNICLIQEELEREPVELSDAELQLAMDGFRRARRLYTAVDARRWMERRGISHAELEELVSDEAMVAKLRRRIAQGRVEAYFAARRADFDTVRVARVTFASRDEACVSLEQVRSGDVDFYALAERHFVTSNDVRGASVAFDVVQRSGQPGPVAEAAFAARPGEIVGPVFDGQAYAIALVLSHTPAQLDPPTRSAIERLLFEEWLDGRRARSDIEWHWWNSARTTPGVPNDA